MPELGSGKSSFSSLPGLVKNLFASTIATKFGDLLDNKVAYTVIALAFAVVVPGG